MSTHIDIKALRKARGWSQKQMAEYFGVVPVTVARWTVRIPENGSARRLLEHEWNATFGEKGHDGEDPPRV